MAKDTGRARAEDQTVFEKDDSAIIKDQTDIEKLTPERKDQYLKRIKAENEALKQRYKVQDEWIEVIGKKVLIRQIKANGNSYTKYWFNSKRYEAEYQNLLSRGGRQFEDEKGVTRFVALRYVNGRPHKKKEA